MTRKNSQGQISSRRNRSKTPTCDLDKSACFELARFYLPDYPNEKITFVKFLDDNDPRLLFLVTYNKSLDTTYMKVIKIEKKKNEDLFDRERSFSFYENQPYVELKRNLIKQQQDQDQENIGGFGFATNENLKATLKKVPKSSENTNADISITSTRGRNVVKLKTEFDPETRFQQILMEQIDEIERLEFQEDDDEVKEAPVTTEFDRDRSRTIRNVEPVQNNSIQKYEMIQSKLGKFKSTNLKVVHFGPAYSAQDQSRSKQMISVD